MADYRTLVQQQDEWGSVAVLDDGDCRILAFGEHDEQSKLLKKAPHVPQHTYVQAMLLALLYLKPKSAIILGLGGGALVHALRHFDAAIKLTAVELRPLVLELAKSHFQLPLSKKLNLINQDANQFLASAEHKKVDIIFADLYGSEGVDAGQLRQTFIEQSLALLKSEGLLVLNCWKEHSQDRGLLARLQQHFPDVRACLTGGGNWVVFASRTPKNFTSAGLKQGAAGLSAVLDCDLGRSLSRFELWQ
ncbi:spermidine synthase [Shewanella chilikensis]|uniref:Spermidine synthase n=1 Tax=Shewanella chilikensis TaxID=558541 RepID=A0ABX5PSX2_9GAMM|nr:spermidine synthase [Shewanella chilikensis]MCL1153362.1 spermidine synthase [Shewanella chilikensis]PYE60798.1 spermidine synthase [Shewanella chilikensis]GGZ18106.1 spermidine synthase [Shewanella chilikensis]